MPLISFFIEFTQGLSGGIDFFRLFLAQRCGKEPEIIQHAVEISAIDITDGKVLGDRQSAADALFIENLVSIDYDGKIYGVFFQLPVENQMIPSVSSGSDFRKFEAAGVVGAITGF